MMWTGGKTQFAKEWDAHDRRINKEIEFARKLRKYQDGFWWFAWYPVKVDKHLNFKRNVWAWLQTVWVGGGHSQSGWRIDYYTKYQRG